MPGPLLQGDESLRYRVDVLTGIDALTGYVRSGGYRRAAQLAHEIAAKLEKLAASELPNDRPRHTVRQVPSRRVRIQPEQPELPPGPRYEITEVKD